MSVFVCGEVGSNHEGSLGRALKLIDIAVEAKADAVKFQLIKPFQKEWIDILINYCGKKIEFMATPFSKEGVEALRGKVKHWKIASPEADRPEFVQWVKDAARVKDTILISDGCTNSIENYIQLDDWSMDSKIIPMACVMKYPADEEDYHFYHSGVWGLSDHTEHLLLPSMAVAHGACVIEKHFTDDKSRKGPDHAFALNPEQLKEMVGLIRLEEKILGNKKLTIKEPKRSIVWP